MFNDPQEVTINSVEKTLARVLIDGSKAVYTTADELWTLTISHQRSGNRTRTMARLDQKAIVTNPLDSTNDFDVLTTYYVIDRPDFGFTQTQIDHQLTGLAAWLGESADKLFGREI